MSRASGERRVLLVSGAFGFLLLILAFGTAGVALPSATRTIERRLDPMYGDVVAVEVQVHFDATVDGFVLDEDLDGNAGTWSPFRVVSMHAAGFLFSEALVAWADVFPIAGGQDVRISYLMQIPRDVASGAHVIRGALILQTGSQQTRLALADTLVQLGMAEPPGVAVSSPVVAPNPIAEDGAVVWYALPDGTRSAYLLVLNVAGELLAQETLDVSSSRFPTEGRWIPSDESGARLGNGPYVLVILADGRRIALVRIVIMR